MKRNGVIVMPDCDIHNGQSGLEHIYTGMQDGSS